MYLCICLHGCLSACLFALGSFAGAAARRSNRPSVSTHALHFLSSWSVLPQPPFPRAAFAAFPRGRPHHCITTATTACPPTGSALPGAQDPAAARARRRRNGALLRLGAIQLDSSLPLLPQCPFLSKCPRSVYATLAAMLGKLPAAVSKLSPVLPFHFRSFYWLAASWAIQVISSSLLLRRYKPPKALRQPNGGAAASGAIDGGAP
eukprot:SAG22_NODE_465_length_10181_cov_6.604444_2_plen_206_part_00